MDANAFVLTGDCSIGRAAEHRDALLAALAADEGRREVAVDMSGVTDFDSAGLQLLLALRRSLLDAGRPMRLLSPSEAVRQVLATYWLCPEDLQPLNAETTP